MVRIDGLGVAGSLGDLLHGCSWWRWSRGTGGHEWQAFSNRCTSSYTSSASECNTIYSGKKGPPKTQCPYLKVAILHTPKNTIPPQLLKRHPRAIKPNRDSGQEPRIVPDLRGRQHGLHLRLLHPPFPRQPIPLHELDPGLRKTEIAMPAPPLGHRIPVGEMVREGPAQTAASGDEVDDAPDALHVALLSGFDLRVDGVDDLGLGVVAAGEVAQDAEAVHDSTGVELDGSAVVPLLQFLNCVGAGEAPAGGGGVDVDVRVLFGRLAGLFEGFSHRGGVGGAGFEGWGFRVFVFGVLGRD